MGRKAMLLAGVFLAPLMAAAAPGTAHAGDIRITPSVEVGQTYTDNVLLSPTNRQSDWVQSVSPKLQLERTGPRLNLNVTGGVDYLYFDKLNKDDIRPDVLGTASYIAVPDLLKFDANVEVRKTLVDPAGGFTISPYNDTPNRETLQLYSAGPTLFHHFGPIADAQVTYTFSYANVNNVQFIQGAQSGGLNHDYVHDVVADVTSGPRFTRFQWDINGEYIHSTFQQAGAGALGRISRDQYIARFTGNYIVNYWFALIATAGYDHISTSNNPQGVFPLQGGPSWSAGFELKGSRSDIRITAGHRFGGFSMDASGRYDISPRLTLTAAYTDEITTSVRRLTALLNLAAANSFASTFGLDPRFTLSDEYFRSRRGSLTLSGTRGRNTMSIDGFVDRRSYRILPQGDWIYGVQGTFDRQLNRKWTLNLLGLYTYQHFNNFQFRRDDIYAASAGVTDQFARSLSASVTYRFSYRNSSDPTIDAKENAVTLLLTATF